MVWSGARVHGQLDYLVPVHNRIIAGNSLAQLNIAGMSKLVNLWHWVQLSGLSTCLLDLSYDRILAVSSCAEKEVSLRSRPLQNSNSPYQLLCLSNAGSPACSKERRRLGVFPCCSFRYRERSAPSALDTLGCR